MIAKAMPRLLHSVLLSVYSAFINIKRFQIARNLVPQQQTCQVWIRSDEQFSRYVKYNHTDTQTDFPCFIVSWLEQSDQWTATTEYLEGSARLEMF